jgi:hypothetical protein
MEDGDRLKEHDTGGLYHGGWAFRRDASYRVRGYGPHNSGEDQEVARRRRPDHRHGELWHQQQRRPAGAARFAAPVVGIDSRQPDAL